MTETQQFLWDCLLIGGSLLLGTVFGWTLRHIKGGDLLDVAQTDVLSNICREQNETIKALLNDRQLSKEFFDLVQRSDRALCLTTTDGKTRNNGRGNR